MHLPTVFSDKRMYFTLHCLPCIISIIFNVAGGTSASLMVCGFLSFAIKREALKEAFKHLSLTLVKFCKILD